MPRKYRNTKIQRDKINSARRIVLVCMRIANKALAADFVDLVARHIVSTLPARTMRHIVHHGLASKCCLDAMKLTLPYLKAA